MQKDEQTNEWQQYLDGVDYNNQIGLYNNVNLNEAMFAGDQWRGVVANGLPKPVFNIYKRIINYFIAAVMSKNVAVNFVPQGIGDDPTAPEDIEIKEAGEMITAYYETLVEQNKMHQKRRQWLLDAALSGDAVSYNFWDDSVDYGLIKGDICIEEIDAVNLIFGNPNDKRVQKQPWIIIPFRELVVSLKEEALKNGVPEDKIKLITGDTQTEYQSGDRSKIELQNKDSSTAKTTALLKFWKKDGKIYAKKSTRYTDIRPEWELKNSLYPVALMNWDPRKNSYHGQAVGTGLVPNQIFINKMFAMAMMGLMHTAFPKLIYNKTLITAVNNQIGAAIGVDGIGTDVNIGNVAQYLNAGDMSGQVERLIDLVIATTKDMLGATDASLGEIDPKNTSAIIATQKAAAIPLESVEQNLYQFEEDNANIWLDFMANYYGVRTVDIKVLGKRETREFDFAKLKKMRFRIKIDVGASSYWSEIAAMQTLDNLLQADRINFTQYLNRVPNGIIPQKQELIKEIEDQDIKQQFIWEQMAKFMDTLPPDQKAQVEAIKDPQQMEDQIMQMMMQPQPQQPQQTADPQAVQAQLQQQQNQQAAQTQQMQLAQQQQGQMQQMQVKHQQDLQKSNVQHQQKMELAHVGNFGKIQLAKMNQMKKGKTAVKK